MIQKGVCEFYIYGGKGSAKTVTISQIISKLCIENNEKAICFRKESTTIATTLENSFNVGIKTSRLENAYKKMQLRQRSTINNAEVIFKGIDDENKVKGIEGYSYLYHDELDQFNEQDYTESINAFRGEVAKVYFAAWNPTDIESFVKTEIIDVEKWQDCEEFKLPSVNSFVKINSNGKKALIKTLYSDNYWMVGSSCGTYGYIDTTTIERYESRKEYDPHWYSVNVLGEWGVIKPTDPFFMNFDMNKHVKMNLEISKHLPIYLSFDFNVIYSCVVGQSSTYERWFRRFKDYYEDGLDLEDLVKEIVRDFGYNFTYIITGDASGNNTTLGSKNNSSCYDTIRSTLISLKVNFEFMVPTTNLSHVNSRIRNNAIHKREQNNFYDQVGCSRLIADMQRLRTSRDGGLNKQDAIKYNYGHLSDAERYFNDVFLYDVFESYGYDE